ncbi:hypothetical protein ADUPG1_000672, partial [Aduncisulcus paluster]
MEWTKRNAIHFLEREREQARTRMSRGQRSQAVAVSSILDHIGEEERGFDSESFTRLPSECFEDVDIEVPLDTPPAWYSIVSSLRHHQHDLAEISESETTHCTDTLSDDSHPNHDPTLPLEDSSIPETDYAERGVDLPVSPRLKQIALLSLKHLWTKAELEDILSLLPGHISS